MSNVIDNVFLNQEKAGADVAKAEQKAGREVLALAIKTIKTEVKTVEDAEAFLKGYADQMKTTNKNSVKTMKSRMRRLVNVMLASDKKLNAFHKLSKPADGQKLVDKLAKTCAGIKPMYEALNPEEPAPESEEGEGEGESGTNDTHDSLVAWWAACEKLGHSDKFGLTTDEMLAFVERTVLGS